MQTAEYRFFIEKGNTKQNRLLDPLPVTLPANYLEAVNEVPSDDQLTTIRYSVNKGKPYGTLEWVEDTIKRFGLDHTVRGPGRPKK